MWKSERTFLAILLIVLTLVFTGCNSGSGKESGNPESSGSGSGQRLSDISQWGGPERRPDLTGKVKTIRGNKLTIFKAEGSTSGTELSEEERAARRAQMQSLSPEEKEKIRAEQNKVTSETVDLIIPVGTPVLSVQNISGKVEVKELDIADIKEGAFLRLWLESKPSVSDSKEGTGSSGSSEPLYVEFVQVTRSGGF